jgi:hypothetical protein
VFSSPKKLGRAVTRWVDGASGESNKWNLTDDEANVGIANSALETWHIWKTSGVWPLGNWLKAPLYLLVRMNFVNVVYDTWQHYRKTNDMTKMTPTQLDVVRWYERD